MDRTVQVSFLAEAHPSANAVFDRIEDWMRLEGLGLRTSCVACAEDFCIAQGVACEQGHFFCNRQACLQTVVREQQHVLVRQHRHICCPDLNCRTNFHERDVIRNVCREQWDLFLGQELTAKVKRLEARARAHVKEHKDNTRLGYRGRFSWMTDANRGLKTSPLAVAATPNHVHSGTAGPPYPPPPA